MKNIELSNNGSDISVSFVCGHFTASGSHYLGFDYTNVYDTPEYLKMYEENSYVFDEQYFREEMYPEDMITVTECLTENHLS